MHAHRIDEFTHRHDYAGDHAHGEARTRAVIGLTAAMMALEIGAGTLFGSMALLADGWHMATHVAAFAIALFAYRFARTHAADPRYSFGTGKVGVLGGFASAMALAAVALMMILESVLRLARPHEVQFGQALAVAVLGLAVNLVCGWLLHDGHHHGHGHGHEHQHDHDHAAASDRDPAHEHHGSHHRSHHHDHNLRAAYLHVLADALTSVLAIVALLAGYASGWGWLDPVMGLVGAAVILRWAAGLLRETAPILLDGAVEPGTAQAVRRAIEADADNKVSDLHLWVLGPGHHAVIVALLTHDPRPPAHYKALLSGIPGLAHVIVEVNPCPGDSCQS